MSNLEHSILLINGANLNQLGFRNEAIYGTKTLVQIEQKFADSCKRLGYNSICYQSNSSGEIINFLQDHFQTALGIVVNLGAWSHYDHAIADALLDTRLPYVEVHISDIYSRQEFRKKSVIKENAIDSVIGRGVAGYQIALENLHQYILQQKR